MNKELKTIEKKYEIDISKFKKTFKIPQNEKITTIKLIGSGLLGMGENKKIKIIVTINE